MVEIVIVERAGALKQTKIKDFKYSDLYKKCKFRKSDGFDKRAVWEKKINGEKVIVELWARNSGKANTENKYDFPPPVDNALYFGACALVGKDKNKEGEVIEIDRANYRAKVKEINMVKKHIKTTKEKKGGIVSKESFIHISNLKLIDEKAKIEKKEVKK